MPEPLTPPELGDQRLIVRSTHVEAPSLDGAERYPDLWDEDDPRQPRYLLTARGSGYVLRPGS